MPALAPYIPNPDADYNNWLANFSALITATPMAYGLSSADAATIAAAQLAWSNAYSLVTSPSTKTASTVQAKNIQRVSSQNVVRIYAQQISLNPGVTADNKIALGLNPRTSTPTPITAPTTYPQLTNSHSLSLQTILTYRDSLASPSVKSKPYGVTQMYLYASTSATAITDPTLLKFQGPQTKSPLALPWASGQIGLTAYIAGRWATRKGLLGPWSPIITATVTG